jgi:hypothetical protein
VIFSKEFETANGVLRIAIDVSRLLTDVRNYTMKLQQARGIPMNLEAIAPNDPVVQFITKNMPWVPADRVIHTAIEHYEMVMREVEADAGLVTMTLTSDKSCWERVPTPYDPPIKDEFAIEGDIDIPEPERDLRHPTERRVKQIRDIMIDNPASFMDMQEAISTALILVQRNAGAETDDDGFRPGSTRKPVRGKSVANRVEPQV